MNNPELTTYVKTQFQQGVSPAEIRNALQETGWPNETVEAAFAEAGIYGSDAPPTPPAEGSNNSRSSQMSELPGISDLLSHTVRIFKSNWQRFVGISLLPMALWFGFAFVAAILIIGGAVTSVFADVSSMAFIIPAVLIGIAALVAFSVISVWFQVAMIKLALNQGEMSVSEALAESKGKIWSFLWVGILLNLMIFGGFALFVIPAIIFAVWFSFAIFVVVDEDKKGFDALMASREYVRGKGQAVVGRLFVAGFLIGFISMLLTGIFEGANMSAVGSLVSFAFSMITTPLLTIYSALLFKDLQAMTGKLDLAAAGKKRFKYLLVILWGLIGMFVLPALLAMAIL